jgi:transcriptional regulator with XRE-family HTH domain
MINVELIEQLRKEHGYSQRQMAKLMGYDSHAAYNRKINGERAFLIEDIIILCKLYQLEPNDLIKIN